MRSVDGRAARLATVLAVVAVAVALVGQSAVAMAFTSGTQPVAVVDAVPADPTAAQWADAPERTVSMSAQQMAPPYGGGTTGEVTVQAVTNESHVAFRLTWQDPTMDADISEPRAFSDAAAIMLRTGEQPPIMMGAGGTPVNIWYWRASWQERTDVGGDMYAYPHPDNETRPGLAADNPLSQADYDQFAQNYYAKGYGSLSYAGSQPVSGVGERTDDGWSVVFVRERAASGEYGADFGSDEPVYMAFAIWNGSADEANGQKSLTYQFTKLEEGALQAVEDGSDSGSGGATPGGGTQENGRFGLITTVVSVALLVWMVSYWRLRGRDG